MGGVPPESISGASDASASASAVPSSSASGTVAGADTRLSSTTPARSLSLSSTTNCDTSRRTNCSFSSRSASRPGGVRGLGCGERRVGVGVTDGERRWGVRFAVAVDAPAASAAHAKASRASLSSSEWGTAPTRTAPASTARETSARETSAPAPTARETSARETSAPASTAPSTALSPASACDLASTRREILSRIDRAAVRSAACEKKTQDVVLRTLRTLQMDRANRQHHTKMILAAVRESRERVEVKIIRLSERFRAVEQSSARTEVRASADVASRGRDGEGNLVGPPRNVDEYRTRGAEVSGAEVRGAEVRGAEVRGETGNGLASDRHPPGRKYTGPSDPRTSRRRSASGVNAGERANGVGYAYASGFDFASASGLPRTPVPWTNTASGR